MKIVEPSYEIIDKDEINGKAILRKIERIGRVSYKSEGKITDDSADGFVRNIIKRGHESVLEHVSVSVRIVCDRGVSHELVRHRLASYTQESTRYCDYSDNRFGHDITVIRPFFWEEYHQEYEVWLEAMRQAEKAYFSLLGQLVTPQGARSVLPNSLKTEVVMTANLREWRHFFKLRTAPDAHPQMRQITVPMLEEFKTMIPVVFDDILE